MKITSFKKFHKNRAIYENTIMEPVDEISAQSMEEEEEDVVEPLMAQAQPRMAQAQPRMAQAQPRMAQAQPKDDVAMIAAVKNGKRGEKRKTAQYKGFEIDYYSETESFSIGGKTSFKVEGKPVEFRTPEEVVSFLAEPKNHSQVTQAQAQSKKSQAQVQSKKSQAQVQRMTQVQPKGAQVLPNQGGQVSQFPASAQAQAERMQENIDNLNQRLASLKGTKPGKTVHQMYQGTSNKPADLLRAIKTSSVSFPKSAEELEKKIMDVQSAISFKQSEMRTTTLPEIITQDMEVLEHFLELLQMMQHYFK